MIQTGTGMEKAKSGAQEAVEEVARSPWLVRLARFGYATKGLVYVVVGVTATMTAFGNGESPKDAHGALQTIATQPFGEIVLGVVAFGLVGYVVWRIVQALADVDEKGRDLKGLSIRTGYVFSGLAYAGLAYTAARILLHVRREGDLRRDWTAHVLAVPYGRTLIALLGLGVIVFGVYQIYKGYKAKFKKRLKVGEMGEARRHWAVLSGRVGYAARGVVFCLVGTFLVQAAWNYDPGAVKGLDGALQALISRSFGPVFLGLVAGGLVAYGLYMFVEARHRRIGRA